LHFAILVVVVVFVGLCRVVSVIGCSFLVIGKRHCEICGDCDCGKVLRAMVAMAVAMAMAEMGFAATGVSGDWFLVLGYW